MEYLRIIGVVVLAIAAVVEFVAAFTKPTALYGKNSPYKNDPAKARMMDILFGFIALVLAAGTYFGTN
ncbi:MAG: hypothetical protein ACI4OC_04640 [Coriobacteriales bacterium]